MDQNGHRTEDSPHDLEAEVAVLGSMLLDPLAASQCAGLLRRGDFYRRDHAEAFEALCAIADRSIACDPKLLHEELLRRGVLESLGGTSFIYRISSSVPSAANAEHYAAIVRDRSRRRTLLVASRQIAALSIDPGERTTAEVVAESRALLDGIETESAKSKSMSDILSDVMASLDRSTNGARSVSSGFVSFDQQFGRFMPGNLVLLAARPSVGKTSLALQIAMRAARYDGKRVAFFSLEMTREEVVRNLVCSAGRIDSSRMRPGGCGFLSDDDYTKLSAASGILSALPIFIDDTSNLDPSLMRAKALRLRQQGGVDLVVLDYLQLVETAPYRTKSTTTNDLISWVSRKAKMLAKELECPVIALSQLNRDLEREKRKPRLSDLRDSGSLEQDADVVIFIHREEMATTDPDKKAEHQGQAELIVAKNRTGPLGTLPMRFDGPTFTFDEASPY